MKAKTKYCIVFKEKELTGLSDEEMLEIHGGYHFSIPAAIGIVVLATALTMVAGGVIGAKMASRPGINGEIAESYLKRGAINGAIAGLTASIIGSYYVYYHYSDEGKQSN